MVIYEVNSIWLILLNIICRLFAHHQETTFVDVMDKQAFAFNRDASYRTGGD